MKRGICILFLIFSWITLAQNKPVAGTGKSIYDPIEHREAQEKGKDLVRAIMASILDSPAKIVSPDAQYSLQRERTWRKDMHGFYITVCLHGARMSSGVFGTPRWIEYDPIFGIWIDPENVGRE